MPSAGFVLWGNLLIVSLWRYYSEIITLMASILILIGMESFNLSKLISHRECFGISRSKSDACRCESLSAFSPHFGGLEMEIAV